jgi:tetratricopeptide (TPR) repeat protein
MRMLIPHMDHRSTADPLGQSGDSRTARAVRNASTHRRTSGSRARRLAGVVLAPTVLLLAACGSPSSPAQSASNLVTQGLKAELSGDLTTASHDYQQAITLDANSDIAHFDLGTVYDEQRNRAKAVTEYQTALVIAPNFADALFNLAVDTAGSDTPGAAQLYSKVVTLQPTFAAAWLNLGFAMLSEGNTNAAKADWAKAVSLDATLASRIPKATAAPSGTSTSPKPSPTPNP